MNLNINKIKVPAQGRNGDYKFKSSGSSSAVSSVVSTSGRGSWLDEFFEYNEELDFLTVKKTLASNFNLVAYAGSGVDIPTIWEQMPKASTTAYGGVKIGTGISVTNGVISLDGSSLSPQVLSLSGSTLSLDGGGGSVNLGTITPDLTGYATENWVGLNYLGKTAKAADADKLDGLNSSVFFRDFGSGTYDLNTVLNSGAYKVSTNSTNVPGALHGQLLVVYGGSDTSFQMYAEYSNQDIFWRGGSGAPASITTTWNKIWHSGNDGAGSGLDADKVDNLQAWQFLRSDANDTMNANLTISSQNVDTLTLRRGSGNPSITFLNDSDSEAKAVIYGPSYGDGLLFRAYSNVTNGTYKEMLFDENGRLGINTTSPTEALDVNGNIKASGSLIFGLDTQIVAGTGNVSTGIAVKAINNPAATYPIFAVESSGSATRFGVTQDAGAWFRNGVSIGYAYDTGDMPNLGGGKLQVAGDIVTDSNLDVNGNIKASGSIYSNGTQIRINNGVTLRQSNTIGVIENYGGGALYIYGGTNATGSQPILIAPANTTDTRVVTSLKVGSNTAPSEALDVNGNGLFSGNIDIYNYGFRKRIGSNLSIPGDATLQFQTENNALNRLSTRILMRGASNSDIEFYDENESEYIRFDGTNKRLGIGTITPTEALDVNGNILASGNVTAYSDARLKHIINYGFCN
ncbi:pyocin knob domain-containing protein [Marinilabilia salmonicolor]|uniref:pyocin knob domain-containing protein n=1 Tax=Marinilabilia salmonicolor TaxID=989 RepID=UPI00046AC54B|nr:pyocin knob domain-containing protein [Marinilabilia salmonicolor]